MANPTDATSPESGLHQADYTPGVRGPLTGLRVIDLSRLVAGNLLTQHLADFGADVIKVEPREGDTLRGWRTKGVETNWKIHSRNKRSICLEFRHDEAVPLIRKMIPAPRCWSRVSVPARSSRWGSRRRNCCGWSPSL